MSFAPMVNNRLTLSRPSVDILAMPNLQFAYASPHPVQLSPAVARKLRGQNWCVTSRDLDAVTQLSILPDFTWLNFGKDPTRAHAEAPLKKLAQLQKKTDRQTLVFISGSIGDQSTHDALVRFIYETFSKPAGVETDLLGKPDMWAAVAKFRALRRADRGDFSVRTVASPVPASPVRVPNADLRTDRGNLSIKLVADLFGLPVAEIGRLIGRDKRATLAKTPDAVSLQEPLRQFSDIALLRSTEFGDEAFRKWLRTVNEHMQNRAPIDWIRDGRVRDVGGFVFGALTGQPT